MSPLPIILGMAVITYGTRIAGLLVNTEVPPFWLRFLHFVPIAVFAALVVPALGGQQGEGLLRLVAAVAAAVAIWRTKQLWVGIVVGMAVFWLLRFL